ncbi:hypothetical protein KIL84_007274 [Mauremys mutica]|uniref:Uncharacterized protein n=1 Tax=Mauremys mutica TaxID=74926 RepID=A0A9D3X2H7_9SAUR|nr:hypothetical protein KIL84_007274 [Mauremys mutica]
MVMICCLAEMQKFNCVNLILENVVHPALGLVYWWHHFTGSQSSNEGQEEAGIGKCPGCQYLEPSEDNVAKPTTKATMPKLISLSSPTSLAVSVPPSVCRQKPCSAILTYAIQSWLEKGQSPLQLRCLFALPP